MCEIIDLTIDTNSDRVDDSEANSEVSISETDDTLNSKGFEYDLR